MSARTVLAFGSAGLNWPSNARTLRAGLPRRLGRGECAGALRGETRLACAITTAGPQTCRALADSGWRRTVLVDREICCSRETPSAPSQSGPRSAYPQDHLVLVHAPRHGQKCRGKRCGAGGQNRRTAPRALPQHNHRSDPTYCVRLSERPADRQHHRCGARSRTPSSADQVGHRPSIDRTIGRSDTDCCCQRVVRLAADRGCRRLPACDESRADRSASAHWASTSSLAWADKRQHASIPCRHAVRRHGSAVERRPEITRKFVREVDTYCTCKRIIVAGRYVLTARGRAQSNGDKP